MFLVPGFSFLGSDGRTLGRMAPLRKYTRIEKSEMITAEVRLKVPFDTGRTAGAEIVT